MVAPIAPVRDSFTRFVFNYSLLNISWHDRKVRLDFVYFTHVGQVIYLCFLTLDRPEEVTKSLGRRTPADRVQGTITLTITIIEPSNNSGNYSEMAWTQMYVSSCLKIPIQNFFSPESHGG